jgi:fermentation-respiration switch protein FrsA (DUF1100 family)
MKSLTGSLCYLAILVHAWLVCHSTSEILLLGVAPALLLDRLFFRLLPWPEPAGRRNEIARRLLWFALGGTAFLVFWPSTLEWAEITLLACELSLTTFLVEIAVSLAAKAVRRYRREHQTCPSFRAQCGATAAELTVLLVIAPLGALHPPHTLPRRTPATLGFTFETVQVSTSDNVQLHGWLVPHAEGRANVVFCHGHRGNCGQVMGFLKTLHAMRLNVLACDFRGHGSSPGHTATFGHHETRDVAAAAAYLGQRFPNKPLLIVGVSYGAAVTLQALPDIPDVRAVWVEGTFAELDHVVDHFFRYVPDAGRPGLVGFYNVLGWVDCGFWGGNIKPIDRLEGLRVPICFCHGRADARIPFTDALALYDAYRGPKSCCWIDDGTHNNLHTTHRDYYFEHLRLFFEEHLSRVIANSAG